MIKLKEFFSLRSTSLLILIMPYIVLNWIELYYSPFYKIQNIIFLFLILIIIELFIKILNKKKYYILLKIIIITLTLTIFYSYYIIVYLQNNLHINLRGRIILPITIAFLFIILYFLYRKVNNHKILNVFFLIFSVIVAINQIYVSKNIIIFKTEYKNNYLSIKSNSNLDKPIILIISDEYASPDELYKIYKDSNVYKLSSKLVNKGWKISNSSYSYEISTLHSLSSLFNFNLSKNSNYKNMAVSNIGINKLIHAAIYDSLTLKNISIVNYGIFDIGDSKPLNRLYFYPNTFFEQLLKNSSIWPILYNTGKLEKNGLGNSYYPTEQHNKFIFNNLKLNLFKINHKHFFTYVHLYMPHSPMVYKPEFTLEKVNNLNNYYSYWNFTNKKIDSLLNNLLLENKFRIIITGDHGYRGDDRINPHNTFTAFYGFEQAAIDNIKSVQDLGSLINSSYKSSPY
jgi:hypothetical protein